MPAPPRHHKLNNMKKILKLNLNKRLRKSRTRSRMLGTTERPRLSIFRSNKYVYAQLINDNDGKTMISASTRGLDTKGGKTGKAKILGQKLAESAKKAGIKSVIFDRGSYKYHGRVKAVAEGVREGGLKL